ncbi:hypothetical protein G6L37_05660 [Agrobacterium rubi]|nr:hypothetical protein [Agrobacterium rubi]NTF24845.1 hypothetical protein [Agrobacterium rubi]
MGYIPEQVLEEIAADIQAAAQDIGRKYGMAITFSGIKSQDIDWPTEDGIIFDVAPLNEDDLSAEARGSDFWKAMLGDGADE